MMKKKTLIYALGMLAMCLPAALSAQQLRFSQPHGYCDAPFELQITMEADGEALPAGTTIRYTLDGSEPTSASAAYGAPLDIAGNAVVRAAAFVGSERVTPVKTATYLSIDDILSQPNNPAGYPSQWGRYTTISGTAKADYEMDPDMTNNATLRPKIAEGLKSLPVLSIVTAVDHLFSHTNDPDLGGIYIFTGPPVGDDTGHGWTRPASVELIGGPQGYDLSVDCGLRLHGGHGRLAEKNPKHSFRLVFKKQYGPGTLKYPLFGEDEPSTFNQLVLRCHFGNAWQHWDNGNRQNAQYTRDVWARRMQHQMGRTAVNALYVHVFLNGLYWGVYNIAERVDDQFGKNHLGGKKEDIDVIKVEESGGNHLEASEGDMDAWNELVATAKAVGATADDAAYLRLQGLDADGEPDPALEPLLDVDAFIDYMLINQYGGNTDWDHHNWYAIRRRGEGSQGFRFLCWDSEIIFENVNENNLSKNNGNETPTGLFHHLLRNADFARRYVRRARQVLADDGPLGEASVVALWDSLHHTISTALYAEAARWGDYRRDVHRWQTAGQLYTVDGHYMTERNRLLTRYFPARSGIVLGHITSKVDIDDFDMPATWTPLVASMFRAWDGSGGSARPLDTWVNVDWNFGQNLGGGGVVAGFVGVEHNHYADLSDYDYLVMRGTGSGVRILANRLTDHGPWKQVILNFDRSDAYWNDDLGMLAFPLAALKTMPTNEGVQRNDAFVHLNAIKVDWTSSLNMRAAYLVQAADLTGIERLAGTTGREADDHWYTLTGQRVIAPSHGLYIHHGRKVYVP